ncbi:hypothetical protein [Burkholderia guangdongensis]|uniref:hypothetical protein n=1 Tax=Burkholderia guangdongensis TaxID=1792500 RepID=UPI0015CE1BD7|nr:hypothetical protein [Burkholderia guangdongensis]
MDTKHWHDMKSQDLLLLLKLVALERRTSEHPSKEGRDLTKSVVDPSEAIDSIPEVPDDISMPPQLNLEMDPYSVRGLADATGISKSEISNVLARCYSNGLARSQKRSGSPVVNRRELEEFLAYGVRFVFPTKIAGLARGIPTSLTAPIFQGILRSAGDYLPVWPDPHGDTLGLAVEPLYKTVPIAIRKDETLYMLLATVDSIRVGQPRERKLAITQLQNLLDF